MLILFLKMQEYKFCYSHLPNEVANNLNLDINNKWGIFKKEELYKKIL